MRKFLRRVFCLPESTAKGDKKDVGHIRTQGLVEIRFEAQGPRREEIHAVHESGPPRRILSGQRELTYDCEEFESCNDIYWFRGQFENRNVTMTIKKKPKTKILEMEKEVNLLAKIDWHENVMRYWWHTEDVDHCYVVTDYGMGLTQYIKEQRSMEPKTTFQQLCDAVAFLHGMKILLLNINPRNVRVVEANSIVRIKLTNFESSFQLKHNEVIRNSVKSYRCHGFTAPEIKEGATFSSDIYSLGCLFFYVLTKGNILQFPPNKSHNESLDAFEYSNKKCDIILFVDAIRDMVKFNSVERPNISKIVEHPCFWREHEFFELIMDVFKALENAEERKQIRKFIDENPEYQEKVIGKKWTSRIRLDNSNLKRSGNGACVCSLVKFIRNNYAHANDTRKSKAEQMTDWVDKFPYLVIFLYNVKNLLNK